MSVKNPMSQRPVGMGDGDWAFALRWSAQESLAGSSTPEKETKALEQLLLSLELGDAEAAWELFAALGDSGILGATLCARLIDWAAQCGSISAMSFKRDLCQSTDVEWKKWDERISSRFKSREDLSLIRPQSDFLEEVRTAILR